MEDQRPDQAAPPHGSGAPAPARRRRRDPRLRALAPAAARYADFLPEVQAVSAREHSPLARVLVFTIAAIFLVAVAWAAIAKVDRVATAPGQVRPDGRVKLINHPDGGRVAEILVKEGDKVDAGQALVVLDGDVVDEEVTRLAGEWRGLTFEVIRLEAEAAGSAGVTFPPALVAESPELAQTHTSLFAARQAALDTRRQAADQIIERRDREASALVQEGDSLKGSIAIVADQEKAVRELLDRDFFPRLRYLSIQRQLAELKGQLGQSQDNLMGAFAALDEARAQRERVDRDYLAETLDALARVRRERARVTAQLSQARDRQRKLVLKAPVAGIVQDLVVTAAGQSVDANQPIMRIVPTGESLIIEAQVSNSDIGFITVGQPVKVRVRTYNFVKYGSLDGTVTRIAPDSTKDPNTGESRYTVTIRTAKTYLGRTPADQPVLPGMNVDANLRLGERTILSYLTERVTAATQSAFREP